MTQEYRAFTGKDIPLTSEGNALIFNYPELLKNMYKTSPELQLMKEVMSGVYDTINECEEQAYTNLEGIKVGIAAKLNTRLYPHKAGIKRELTEKSKFPGEKSAAQTMYDNIINHFNGGIQSGPNLNIEYINIDDLLEKTKDKEPVFYGIDIASSAVEKMVNQFKSETKDIASHAAKLIDSYGFSFREAQNIVTTNTFSLDEVMKMIEKAAKQVEAKTKDGILKDIIERYNG